MNNIRTNDEEIAFSMLDIFFIIIKHRWLIVLSTFLSALLIFSYSLYTAILPDDSKYNTLGNYYKPQVQIMIQQSSGSITSQLSSSGASPLSIFMSGGGVKSVQLIMTEQLLASNIIKDQIAREFNFYNKYGLEESIYKKTMARNILQSALEADTSSAAASNIFILSYTDSDPVFATKVLNRIVELLEEKYKELSLERVLRKKRFIEERLQTVEKEFKEAQGNLVSFQIAYGVIDISSQANEQARLIAGLQADVIRNELEVKTLREYLFHNDPKIVRLNQEISKKKQLISELKTGLQEYSGDFIPQNKLPDITTQFLNLKSELEIKKSIYKMLREELEKVKIEENDNSKTFQLIEPAEVPERKAGPSRATLCVVVTIITFVLTIILSFIKEYSVKIRKDPVEAAKINQIRSLLKRKRSN